MARKIAFIASYTISFVELAQGIQVALYCWSVWIIKNIAEQNVVSLHLPFLDLSFHALGGVVKFVLTPAPTFILLHCSAAAAIEVRCVPILVKANAPTDAAIPVGLSCHCNTGNSAR